MFVAHSTSSFRSLCGVRVLSFVRSPVRGLCVLTLRLPRAGDLPVRASWLWVPPASVVGLYVASVDPESQQAGACGVANLNHHVVVHWGDATSRQHSNASNCRACPTPRLCLHVSCQYCSTKQGTWTFALQPAPTSGPRRPSRQWALTLHIRTSPTSLRGWWFLWYCCRR